MFTLNFILLLVFSTLEIDAAENTDQKQVAIQDDSGIISTPGGSQPSVLTQPLGNEFTKNQEEDYYDGEEFQDNRLRLMLQPKKPLTLNETKLRTWPSNPTISNNTPIIAYRNAFAVQLSDEREISGNQITENMSKANEQRISKNYESLTNWTSAESFGVLRNKSEATAKTLDSKERLSEENLLPEGEKAKTEADSRHLEVDLEDLAEEKISNVTVLTGKFVASLSSSKTSSPQIKNETNNNDNMTEESNLAVKPGYQNVSDNAALSSSGNAPPQIKNETINNDNMTEESILAVKPGYQNVSDNTAEKSLEQKEEIRPLITASNDTEGNNVQQTTVQPPNLTNQIQDSENDNAYEELEPDISIEENYTDYITPNETAIDETNTVLIVLPGSDPKKGDKLTETGVAPGKPYISEAISQNLLHLLMNLTVMTAVNERNGKKILRELQEQKGQLQSLRRQSDNIYNYITNGKMVKKINNNKAK